MEKNYCHADLSRVFDYDPLTGIIRWKIMPRLNVAMGSIAGHISGEGYRVICYRRYQFKAHRLAWILHHGSWPQNQIDHINMIRDDNRIENLREADASQNRHNSRAQRNNSHGYKGVAWDAQKRRWVARIMVRGKRVNLGRFRTREEAAEAYSSGAEEYAGEFARW